MPSTIMNNHEGYTVGKYEKFDKKGVDLSGLKCQSSAQTVEFESSGTVIPDKHPYCISMDWYILKIISGYQMSLHTEPKKH